MNSIYVESLIRADMEAVWLSTQEPARHELWNLRFSRIEYLSRPDPDQPQRFRYATRIGAGLEIRGRASRWPSARWKEAHAFRR